MKHRSAVALGMLAVGGWMAVRAEDAPAPPPPVPATEIESLVRTWYPRLARRLDAPDRRPDLSVVFDPALKVPAVTSANRIRLSVDWFRNHPDDTGAVVHELVHVAQRYPPRGPGWVTEGLADYYREWTGFASPLSLPAFVRGQDYRRGYTITSPFLFFVERHYAPDIVDRLHDAMRRRAYRDDLWAAWCGRALDDLWADYVRANEEALARERPGRPANRRAYPYSRPYPAAAALGPAVTLLVRQGPILRPTTAEKSADPVYGLPPGSAPGDRLRAARVQRIALFAGDRLIAFPADSMADLADLRPGAVEAAGDGWILPFEGGSGPAAYAGRFTVSGGGTVRRVLSVPE